MITHGSYSPGGRSFQSFLHSPNLKIDGLKESDLEVFKKFLAMKSDLSKNIGLFEAMIDCMGNEEGSPWGKVGEKITPLSTATAAAEESFGVFVGDFVKTLPLKWENLRKFMKSNESVIAESFELARETFRKTNNNLDDIFGRSIDKIVGGGALGIANVDDLLKKKFAPGAPTLGNAKSKVEGMINDLVSHIKEQGSEGFDKDILENAVKAARKAGMHDATIELQDLLLKENAALSKEESS